MTMASNNSNSIGTPGSTDEKVYIREHFIPPEISMINYFLNKLVNGENSEPAIRAFSQANMTNNGQDSDEDIDDEEKRDVLDEDPEMMYFLNYYFILKSLYRFITK
jgi:hypothetical protein